MADQQKYTNKLKDKHVLIIGGSSGIGYGVAEASLEHGARVTISSSNPKRIAAAVERLETAYPSAASSRISSHVCNLSDEATIEANIANLFKATGSVDHIVYTAGDALAVQPDEGAYLKFLKQAGMVRFFGVILAIREGAKYLTPGPESSITLTSGSVARRPIAGMAAVAPYAGALFSMTQAWALDLKPVRVNCIVPGAVETELWDNFPEELKKEMFKKYEDKMTTGRVGRVEDVAEAYLYAMRDTNVSGSVIDTNGGNLLMS